MKNIFSVKMMPLCYSFDGALIAQPLLTKNVNANKATYLNFVFLKPQ